ncbi:MAG: amidohydrolase family protein [Saprospiraceae bacterium]|nr:amidohydrolase family protein [Saprospiraceae bacterium]
MKEALGVGIFAMMDMFTLDSRANYLRTFNDSTNYAHYYSSNVGATVPNGHGTQYRVQIPTINDTLTAEDFVRDRVNFGADYIKITQENTMAKLSGAQLQAIIETAHEYHKITVAHISALDDCHELIEHGVDGFAHIWYRMPSFAPTPLLKLMKDKEIFIIPTLSVIEKLLQHTDTSELKNLLTFEQVLMEVNKAYHENIPILAGTDARNYGMNYTTQYFDELVFLSKSGMPNLEVLKAGTSNIYKAFELKEFSNLTKNSAANFILLDGQPHLNIEDIYLKKRIWKFGRELIAS